LPYWPFWVHHKRWGSKINLDRLIYHRQVWFCLRPPFQLQNQRNWYNYMIQIKIQWWINQLQFNLLLRLKPNKQNKWKIHKRQKLWRKVAIQNQWINLSCIRIRTWIRKQLLQLFKISQRSSLKRIMLQVLIYFRLKRKKKFMISRLNQMNNIKLFWPLYKTFQRNQQILILTMFWFRKKHKI